MFNKENEYNQLIEKFGWIPHEHKCEIEMLYGKWGLKEYCPYTKKQLKKECYCQCDSCEHMIYIVFDNKEQTRIKFIDRLQG